MRPRKSLNEIALRFLILAGCLIAAGCAAEQTARYSRLKYPKLGEVAIPKVERVTLANGMKLLLVEDHELPLINASAIIRVGSVYEPADRIGLASICGSVMRTGGTTTKTGDQIDEELEQIAASVETGMGQTSGRASMSVLKEDADKGLAVLADVLMNPAFRQDKIELAKIQHRSSIARRNDNMRSIAGREYVKLIYGPQSIYARHTEYATIDNITRDDLVAFHRKFYHPNNVMLGVAGDFDTKEMIKKVEAAFKTWQRADVDLPKVPPVQYEFRSTVNVVSKDDINQSAIYMGHIACMMNDPDYHALTMMNSILGDSFTSRLFKNVRSRKGLAYSVFGVYSADYDHPGAFYVGCQTKSDKTVVAIQAMTEEVRKMTESEVTDEELALAKDSYLNSFVFNFENRAQVLSRLMVYDYFGYPPDFLEKTKANIEKVTKEDVLRVAKKHLQPDKMQILVVGRPQDFGEPLSVLGPVNTIDVTIPALKPQNP